MTVFGSWPGREWGNKVISEMCRGIELEGSSVIDVPDLIRCNQLGEIDTLVVHWPEMAIWGARDRVRAVCRMLRVIGKVASIKSKNCKLIWIAHNSAPHDLPATITPLWKFYSRAFCSHVDGWLTLSPSTKRLVVQAHPSLSSKIWDYAWHPAYKRPQIGSQRAARVALNLPLEERVILYCGLIRPYKGLEELILAFKQRPERDIRLVISGHANDAQFEKKIRKLAHHDKRILLRFLLLTENEFDLYLSAADLFAAPFRSILHSGSVVHALSAGLPVVVPAFPFTEDLSRLLGERWLRLTRNPIAAADLDVQPYPAEREFPDLAPLSAEAMGRKLVSLSSRLHAADNQTKNRTR